MEATTSTLALAASISKFDVVELWIEESPNVFECKYIYATPGVRLLYPEIIVGHYPQHYREHVLSPQVNLIILSEI